MGAEWLWLDPAVVLAVHEQQLAEHGGLAGVRDPGLLESALARPRHLAVYGSPDASDLAAAYAVGLARNHAFIDGNKRTALVMMELFLVINGWRLGASDGDCAMTMLGVASGEITEAALVEWLRERIAVA